MKTVKELKKGKVWVSLLMTMGLVVEDHYTISQTSPILFPFSSAWSGLNTSTQLSSLSGTPSPSASGSGGPCSSPPFSISPDSSSNSKYPVKSHSRSSSSSGLKALSALPPRLTSLAHGFACALQQSLVGLLIPLQALRLLLK